MLRAERIFESEGIQDELDAYNPLIPDGANWKVTLLIEFPDENERRIQLTRLKGVEALLGADRGSRACVRHRRRRSRARERRKDLIGAFPALRAESRNGRGLQGRRGARDGCRSRTVST